MLEHKLDGSEIDLLKVNIKILSFNFNSIKFSLNLKIINQIIINFRDRC